MNIIIMREELVKMWNDYGYEVPVNNDVEFYIYNKNMFDDKNKFYTAKWYELSGINRIIFRREINYVGMAKCMSSWHIIFDDNRMEIHSMGFLKRIEKTFEVLRNERKNEEE